MTDKSESIANKLRQRLADVHARSQGLQRQRELVTKAAAERHDAIASEMAELQPKAGTDEKAAARLNLLLDERARCARVAAA